MFAIRMFEMTTYSINHEVAMRKINRDTGAVHIVGGDEDGAGCRIASHPRLLRARRERPRSGRAAEQCDELASSCVEHGLPSGYSPQKSTTKGSMILTY
jgi:hypothetical protein